MKNTIIALAASVVALGSVNAQTTIISPDTISTAITGSVGEAASGLIDGVIGFGFVIPNADFTPGSTITFGFNSPVDLNEFIFVNDAGGIRGDGIDAFDIEFFSGTTSLGSFSGNGAAGTSAIPTTILDGDTFAVGGFAGVDSAVFTVNSIHDNSVGTNNGFQVQEIAFGVNPNSPVPEPSSALLLGLSALGFLGRRKR